MNSLISGFCVAFSMYSFIPMPQLTWDKKTMRYALCFLPFVGVLIGACQYLWFLFCTHFDGLKILRPIRYSTPSVQPCFRC